MENNYKGYKLFNDIKDVKLRAYNRIRTMMNINEAMGEQQAEHYVESFSELGKKDMAVMAAWIKRDGLENVSKQLGT